jgi:hypothetical protein
MVTNGSPAVRFQYSVGVGGEGEGVRGGGGLFIKYLQSILLHKSVRSTTLIPHSLREIAQHIIDKCYQKG